MTYPPIDLRTTSYGGRSFFATQPIAQGIQILACEAPSAHVIYRDYRREVCAQCFAYAASTSRSIDDRQTWGIRSSREGSESVWFCTDDCRLVWESERIGPLIAQVNAILAKSQIATRKNSAKDGHDPIFSSGPDVQVTQDYINKAWREAEDLAFARARLSSYCSTMNLEDMELEIARLVASAIAQRYVFDQHLINSCSLTTTMLDPWSAVLDLQSSELSNVRLRPYVLLAHLRVYLFLCHSLPKNLRQYASIVRVLLARDTGNAFGIWDGDDRDEMLGWGVWVGASYFNHSCCPNLNRTRVGRTIRFTASRPVEAGEELCISYIDINQSVAQRKQELVDNWFFECQCQRCRSEGVEETPQH